MRYVFIVFLFFNLSAQAQALRDINYSFLYEPTEPFTLDIKPIRTTEGWRVLFNFTSKDTAQQADQYVIRWDIRTSLSDKEGSAVNTEAIKDAISKNSIEGTITLGTSQAPQILVAKVLNNYIQRAWVLYKILEPNYPVNGYLTSNGRVVEKPFVKRNTPVSVVSEGETVTISHYINDFPAALPPFSEGMGTVSRSMRVDTTYTLASGKEITFAEKGLYLVQKDTSDVNGLAFRVEDDYPRFARVESLADPLIYICTKQEFDRVKAAKGDKKAFDKVILNITGNAERAKNFMRNYFRRVEWANYYFTSYKEGWKTDRGMIFILFGLPDQLFKFDDREVWKFDNKTLKATFNFVKSSTIFDPDNYVLIREKKFQETWYEKIDLWRNARF
ncbi:MAG: GWxTD domain-containing protein [Cyclobacteriaceae bacterium]|nr:GWxTD domain-containing protein [Cyclobacteriaceae bacterium]MDH4296290.1 GWxTD domain-containing protein [Cyclobacteriaceae bacterium]MDH5248650.1 GWxTD domain-containing protein [Cyclobacteriaceae bacterium]